MEHLGGDGGAQHQQKRRRHGCGLYGMWGWQRWPSWVLCGLSPKDTFVPQLFGVAGGTVGALAVMLGTGVPLARSLGCFGGQHFGT